MGTVRHPVPRRSPRANYLLSALALVLLCVSSPVAASRATADGISISGMIRDVNGGPISGATVKIFNIGTATVLTLVSTVITGGDGTYSVAVGASCNYMVVVSKPSDTSLADAARMVSVGQISSPGNDVSLKSITVSGRVYRPDGNSPAENAVVQASLPHSYDTTSVYSRADGTYFMHLDTGDYSIQATPRHADIFGTLASLSTSIQVSAQTQRTDDVNFSLRDANVFGRLFIEGTSTPLASAYVSLTTHSDSSNTPESTSAMTREDGTFALVVSPSGPYSLRTYLYGVSPAEAVVDWTARWDYTAGSSEVSPISFYVKRPNLRGRILPPTGDTPLPGAKMSIPVSGDQATPKGSVGADGRFGYYVEPGDYTVVAVPSYPNDANLTSSTVFVTVPDSGVLERDIRLLKSARQSFSVERFNPGTLDLCTVDVIDRPREHVLGMSADGSRALVDKCAATDGSYASVHSIVLIDTASKATIATFPGAGDAATLSRDGLTVAWATEDPYAPSYELSIARAPNWSSPASITRPKPSNSQVDRRPVLSSDGSRVAFYESNSGADVVRVCGVLAVDLSLDCDTNDKAISIGGVASRLRMSSNGSTISFQRTVNGTSHQAVIATPTEEVPNYVIEGGAGLSISDDGLVAVWKSRDIAKLSKATRVSTNAQWVAQADFSPIDERRIAAQYGAPDNVTLSGDGARVYFSSAVRDLLYPSSSGFDQFSSPQLWSYDLDGASEPKLVSIDPATNQPFGGIYGSFGGFGSLVVSADGETVGFSGSVEEPSGPYTTASRQRVYFAVDAGNAVYEFPDDAEITATIGSQTVVLSWPAASGKGVTYRVSRVPAGQTPPITTSSTSAVISNLTAATTYDFTVSAIVLADGTTGDRLTKSITTSAARSRNLAVNAGAGGKLTFTWDAEPLATGCELRATLDNSVGNDSTFSVAAAGQSAQKSGLAANSWWRAAVWCTVAGAEQTITDEVVAKVPALSMSQLSWTAQTSGRFLKRTGLIDVTLVGERGRTGTALIARLLTNGNTTTSSVSLVESITSPGTYTGSLAVLGTARVEGVDGRISDGQGGAVSITSTQGKATVESIIDVALTGNVKIGWAVLLTSADGSIVKTKAIVSAGAQTVSFDGLKATSALTAKLLSSNKTEMEASEPLDIGAGATSTIAIAARDFADVKFVARSGVGPVVGLRIDATVGKTFRQLITNESGEATIPAVLTQTPIKITVYPTDSLAQSVNPVDDFVVTGDREVAISVTETPRATLRGRVVNQDNKPISRARVYINQKRGDASRSDLQLTDANGEYSFTDVVPGVSTTVTVVPHVATGRTQQVIPGAVTTTVNFAIEAPYVYMVPISLYPPNTATPVALDWRTAVHFRMDARVEGRAVSASALQEPLAGEYVGMLAVSGSRGEVLKVCFDGVEAGAGDACGEITLPGNSDTVGELRVDLPRVRSIEGAVNGPGGQPYSGAVSVSIESNGAVIWNASVNGPKFSIPIRSTGALRLSFRGNEEAGRVLTATTNLSVTDDSPDTVPIPETLVLASDSRFGVAGNDIIADRTTVAPGGSVEFRARWVNGGGALSGVVARIGVPADTTLNLRSVMLGTTPVDSSAIVVTADPAGGHIATVSVGDLAVGARGALRWRLNIGTAIKAVNGTVSLGTGSSFDKLPDSLVPVAGISLVAPANPSTRQIAVRGRAVPNSTVAVMYRGVALASTAASSAGAWNASVTLPLRADGTVYPLTATSTLAGNVLTSSVSRVKIATNSVKATDVCVRQIDPGRTDGRRYCFDPSSGVSAFPFVFVPGQTLQVEVFTNASDRVDSLSVQIGAIAMKATRRLLDPPPRTPGAKVSAFVAEFTSSSIRGGISIKLSARPIKAVVPEFPKPEDLISFVSEKYLDATPSALTNIVETSDSFSFSQTVDVPRTTNDIEYTATFRASSAKPSPTQAAEMARTGSSVWDLTLGEPNGEGIRRLSFKMLAKDVPGADVVKAASSRIRVSALPNLNALCKAACKSIGKVIGESVETAFDVKSNIDDVSDALAGGDKYEEIGNVIGLISDCVKPGTAQALIARGQSLLVRARNYEATNSAVAVAGVIAGPETLGIGTVLIWGASALLSDATDRIIEQETSLLRQDVINANTSASMDKECRKKPKKDPEPDAPPPPSEGDAIEDPASPTPIAWPTWIYDPSGYAYEGLESNRVTGVTATLLRAADVADDAACPEEVAWSVVDMEPFGQINPVLTDENGRYGWDVPEGCWKVQWQKDGYETKYSKALKVLPPHLDVHVSMVAISAPTALSATLRDDEKVVVAFNRLMTAAQTVSAITLEDPGGHDVTAAIDSLGAATSSAGRQLALTFSLTPATELVEGVTYSVIVSTDAVDYADRAVATEQILTFQVPSSPEPPTTTPPSTSETTPPSSSVPETSSTTTTTPATSTTAPAATPTTMPVTPPATTIPMPSNVVKLGKTASRTTILLLAKVTVSTGSRVGLSVPPASSKICRISGSSVKMIAIGTCKVVVTVTSKVGKKTKVTKKTVTLKSAKK